MEENSNVLGKSFDFKLWLKKICNKFFITAFSGMAQGLFCTLIAGTILAQIAGWFDGNYFGRTLLAISNIAKSFMGAGIGVGIAYSLKKGKLIVFSSSVAGFIGAFADKLIYGGAGFISLTLGVPGNPIGAYVVTMLVCEVIELYEGKTKLDIILIPIGALILAFIGIYAAYPFIFVVNKLGFLIALATNAKPLIMGIVISVVMGVLLTMPTSSAAIWITVANPVLTSEPIGSAAYNAMLLAGGAAVTGCSCHMIGFAVTSYRENGVSGLISQGIGTSMLQIPNIMKKPVIMVPELVASAVLGPIATCVFKIYCNASGGGMGTSGLVGLFGIVEASNGRPWWIITIAILLLLFILPAAISLAVSEFLRKKDIIKFGDMKIDE